MATSATAKTTAKRQRQQLTQEEAISLLTRGNSAGSDDNNNGKKKKATAGAAAPSTLLDYPYWLENRRTLTGPLQVTSLFKMVWRRICVDSEFYCRVVDACWDLDGHGGSKGGGGGGGGGVYGLELLLVSSATHLAQLGVLPVRAQVRSKAEALIRTLLVDASPELLMAIAFQENTASMLAPFLGLREYLTPDAMVNVFTRTIRFVYCLEMVSEPSTHAFAASNVIHPFRHKEPNGFSFFNLSHPLRIYDFHTSPLADLRLLHSNIFYDKTANVLQQTPPACTIATTATTTTTTTTTLLHITPYPDNPATHDATFARLCGLSPDDTVAAQALYHGFIAEQSRPCYSSDCWMVVGSTRSASEPAAFERTPTLSEYFSQHVRALLWIRVMTHENIHVLGENDGRVTEGSSVGNAFGLFAGDLRRANDHWFLRGNCDDEARKTMQRFVAHQNYARTFVDLFMLVLALCLDSDDPFGSRGLDDTSSAHVLRSCGGQVHHARDRFEASVLTALQFFEHPEALTGLLATAMSCVTSLLHSATGQPDYSPMMKAIQTAAAKTPTTPSPTSTSLPSSTTARMPLAPLTDYAQWFSTPFQSALLHAFSNGVRGRDGTVLLDPSVHEKGVRFAASRRYSQEPLETVSPPHFHVAIGFADAQDECINLYRSPEAAVATGAVRGAKIELDAASWRSLASLLYERMASCIDRHTTTTATNPTTPSAAASK